MPTKFKKRKAKGSDVVKKNQASKIYTPIIRLRSKELSPLNMHLMNHAFLQLEHSFWQLTSNCKVFHSGTGYHVRLLWRGRISDKVGQRRTSQQYETIIEAENNAYEYRYSLESRKSKENLDKMRIDFELVLEGEESTIIINSMDVPSIKRSKLQTRSKRSFGMSGNHHLNQLANSSINPNNCPPNFDFLSEAEIANLFARKIQRCVRGRDIRRAAKNIKDTLTNQTYRLRIIKYLSKFIQNDQCELLIRGSEHEEILASFSTYDVKNVTSKARHIVDALRTLVFMTENKQQITWLECCEKSVQMNFETLKRARTIADWYIDLHATERLQFRQSARGKASSKAQSPFSEDESLMVQLKTWARQDLEHLTVKKATIFINEKLLSDWSVTQLATYKISYPVSETIVSRWLGEAGFKYTIHKKCYYVDRHEDEDVVADRNTYLLEFFKNEIMEHCWIQIPRWKLNHLKYKEELSSGESDIRKKIEKYIDKHRIYHYTDNDIPMVEVHVDDVYKYDQIEEGLPVLDAYGGSVSVRKPEGKKPVVTFGQDEAIFRSSQLNESCWQIDGVTTLRTKGLGVGLMVSAMTSRAFGFGMDIKSEDMSEINMLRVNKKYADEEAATYLYGSSAKKALTESPFVRYLNYGQGKDGYWTYKHMVLQIEDCVDCMQFLYPHLDCRFELDHSSGHNAERIDGLSTTSINLSWGGKQRKMRDSILSDNDIGLLKHARVLNVGETQSMVFTDTDLPPIFDPDAPKFDQLVPGTQVTRNLIAVELREALEEKGLNTDGKVGQLKQRATEANIPFSQTTGKTIPGYIGKAKGALQIAAERGFISLDGKLADGKKASMRGTSKKDLQTGVVTVDKTTSVVRVLKNCSDFKNEQTQLQYILTLLGVDLRLTPKCHPEIAGIGIEYAWGYAKLRFRREFNDAIALHLKGNELKSLDRSVITIERARKFARKAREYKLTYSLLIHEANGEDATANKSEIEHITKLFKVHRSAIDSDYQFINRA